MRVRKDVELALAEGRPVVALESTIISHGMPYPQNLQTAREVEEDVREHGAIPATIAILGGEIVIGLSDAELERFAQLTSAQCGKVSIRDVGAVLAAKGNGGTTVAATMRFAWKAGIRVFATGGLGGVHRGASETWDVSADLLELGRAPVMVVCAGAKSILDLPRTLEVLETQGVPVVGLRTDDFPAFFTPSSGLPVSARVNSEAEAAALFDAHACAAVGGGGAVLAVPIPEKERARGIEKAIDQALREVTEKQIVGAKVTPFLLARVNELSGGESLRANVALVRNNARVAARVAASLPHHPRLSRL